MRASDDIGYHARRATAEFERAAAAAHPEAVRAHRELADLHRRRMQALAGLPQSEALDAA